MINDRRYAPRTTASLHAQIETDGGRSTVAITHDLSAGGLLVYSHREIAIGRQVTIYVLVDGNQYQFSGKVVRQEAVAHGGASLWRSKQAVAVDNKQQDLAKVLEAIA